MIIEDYLIDQSGHDWRAILADWAWLLPDRLTVWLVNRFGDIIYVVDDGSVHFLDLGAGTATPIAASRDAFCALIDEDDNADNWLLISLTDACVEAGLTLAPGQCYGFKVPPVLGGEYVVDNIEPSILEVTYALLGQLHEQTRDLPDGTRIDIGTA